MCSVSHNLCYKISGSNGDNVVAALGVTSWYVTLYITIIMYLKNTLSFSIPKRDGLTKYVTRWEVGLPLYAQGTLCTKYFQIKLPSIWQNITNIISILCQTLNILAICLISCFADRSYMEGSSVRSRKSSCRTPQMSWRRPEMLRRPTLAVCASVVKCSVMPSDWKDFTGRPDNAV